MFSEIQVRNQMFTLFYFCKKRVIKMAERTIIWIADKMIWSFAGLYSVKSKPLCIRYTHRAERFFIIPCCYLFSGIKKGVPPDRGDDARIFYLLPRDSLFLYFPITARPIVPSAIRAVTYPVKLKSKPTLIMLITASTNAIISIDRIT